MTFQRYPEYKVIGLDWLDEVPKHWTVTSLRRLLRGIEQGWSPECLGRPAERDEWGVLKSGCVNHGIYDPDENKALPPETSPIHEYEVRAGDVLMSRASGSPDLVGSIALVGATPGRIMLSDKIFRIKLEDHVDSAFFVAALNAWYMRSQIERAISGADGLANNLPQSALRGFCVAVPPLNEQRRIATFIDRETSTIDALVADQERLIELLREKRQAVISHAVTKGLNPHVPMKESGVRWLGQIPAHWATIQSRRVFRVRSEPAQDGDEQLTASQKHGVIRQAEFVELEGRRVVEVLMWKENLLHVEPDDFIISMRSFQGGIEWSRLRGSTSYHYVMLTPVKHVVPAFFARLFKSDVYIQALRSTTDLIRDGQELRFSHFVQVDLPVVPEREQAAIAAYLDAETRKTDALIGEAERLITLLAERRTALVSAAVTGQIDVRGLAGRSAA